MTISSDLVAQAALLNASSPLGERLLSRFARAGFARAEVALLQPAEPFLELSGEDIRRRLFLTADADGQELCLRPEFTIPAALAYLAGGSPGRRSDLAFLGPVFRHRAQESGEFLQLGLESIGRTDREAADADMLAEMCQALSLENKTQVSITIGDLALFSALLEALALDGATKRRLSLALGEGRLASLLDPASKKPEPRGIARYSGVLDALKGADPVEAKAFVKDLLSIAGVAITGARSADDIAARFLARATGDTGALGHEQAEILRAFLRIEGHPDAVAQAIGALAASAKLDLSAVMDRFETRIGFMDARGLELGSIKAAAGFSRNLDYYSGFVFDLKTPQSGALPVGAGGRYDRLFERLGADVPAIGAAIWIARLPEEQA